jgi:hypothetical protein
MAITVTRVDATEQHAQHIGRTGSSVTDRELTKRALDGRATAQQTDHCARPQKSDTDQHRRNYQCRNAFEPEKVRDHRNHCTRCKETEACRRCPESGADSFVRVDRGLHLVVGTDAPQHLGRTSLGLVGSHSSCAIHQRKFVRVDVEMLDGFARRPIRRRRFQQLPLRANRHVLPRAHRQGAGEQACETGHQHDLVRHSTSADAQHEREVADEAVVGTEHRGAERAGQTVAAASRQRAHYLRVDLFVGRHRLGSVGVGAVRRSGLGALGQCEHEHRPESPGQQA